MDTQHLSVIAGMISTTIFATSHVPMLVRAYRTKDLRSYSAANMVLANLGNLIHWIYILALPFGPIWFLHGFYTLTTAIMLVWYVQHRRHWSELRAPTSDDLNSSGAIERSADQLIDQDGAALSYPV